MPWLRVLIKELRLFEEFRVEGFNSLVSESSISFKKSRDSRIIVPHTSQRQLETTLWGNSEFQLPSSKDGDSMAPLLGLNRISLLCVP